MRTYTPKPGEIDRAPGTSSTPTTSCSAGSPARPRTLLRGKHKPQFAPHVDTGDFVVIVNAAKVALDRPASASEFALPPLRLPGWSVAAITVGDLLERTPERVVELAVKGMLPKNSLGRAQLKKLKVYAGPEHPHAAQKPQPFEIKQVAQ